MGIRTWIELMMLHLRLKKQTIGKTGSWGHWTSYMPEDHHHYHHHQHHNCHHYCPHWVSLLPEHELEKVSRFGGQHLNEGFGQLGECLQGGEEDGHVGQTFQLFHLGVDTIFVSAWSIPNTEKISIQWLPWSPLPPHFFLKVSCMQEKFCPNCLTNYCYY